MGFDACAKKDRSDDEVLETRVLARRPPICECIQHTPGIQSARTKWMVHELCKITLEGRDTLIPLHHSA